MKLPRIVIAMVVLATCSYAVDVVENSVGVVPRVGDKAVEDLIRDLGNDRFKVREEATRRLWEIGSQALPALQAVARGKDPEQSYRARELIRKIELRVTPDTDPAVMDLVERYARATPGEKPALLEQMRRRRAWRQMLKLYALEANPDENLRQGIEGVAVTAARERILEGDADGAREFLEMAPATPSGLLALAEFHRSQGTLDAEIERSKTLPADKAHGWQLALYRAAGNLEGARDAALAIGENALAAEMAVLQGDPLPWLRLPDDNDDDAQIHKTYTELAIKRWQGGHLRPSDLESLERTAASNRRDQRELAVNALFLLGEASAAESAYAKKEPREAFAYFDSLERIPAALKAFGLDGDKPDYNAWVAERIKRLEGKNADDDEDVSTIADELVMMANFMERRGLYQECETAFVAPMLALAGKDDDAFQNMLASLFGGQQRVNGGVKTTAKIAVAWAGEDQGHWDDVVTAALGEESEIVALWDWLSDIDPKASRPERLEGLLVLCGFGKDPDQLRAKWFKRIWEVMEKTPAEKRRPMLEKMILLTRLSPDLATGVKIWELTPAEERSELLMGMPIMDLGAAGRWGDAADYFLTQIERLEKAKQGSNPGLHSLAAACLRKAGREKEAAIQDEWVAKLALGGEARVIASGYAYGEDSERAAEWNARAARQADPVSGEFTAALESLGEVLMERGEWKQVAAFYEVLAQANATNEIPNQAIARLRLRMQSDLGRALANLPNDRAAAVEILEKCQHMFPSDGSLADFFFPSLRKAGLMKEHDAWFQDSWDRMKAVLHAFPGSDNTYNTAAWLASRARRNLDEAEGFEEKALALNPDQSAYLDTMAEIHFAKGNRAKAIEWSVRAVNFEPNEAVLRKQLQRFRNAPLPH